MKIIIHFFFFVCLFSMRAWSTQEAPQELFEKDHNLKFSSKEAAQLKNVIFFLKAGDCDKTTTHPLFSFDERQMTVVPENIHAMGAMNYDDCQEITWFNGNKLTPKDLEANLPRFGNLRVLHVGETNLEKVNMHECIEKLGRALPHLKSLSLTECSLVTFPYMAQLESFVQNIITLDLSHNPIKLFPFSLYCFKHLENLILSSTELEVLPQNINTFRHLKHLDVGDTKITHLPDSLFRMSHLKSLDISYTNIDALSEEIGNLTNLRYLNFAYTQIINLPWTIEKLVKLEELFLSGLPKVMDDRTIRQLIKQGGGCLLPLTKTRIYLYSKECQETAYQDEGTILMDPQDYLNATGRKKAFSSENYALVAQDFVHRFKKRLNPKISSSQGSKKRNGVKGKTSKAKKRKP